VSPTEKQRGGMGGLPPCRPVEECVPRDVQVQARADRASAAQHEAARSAANLLKEHIST
jgi:hypothetical protein